MTPESITLYFQQGSSDKVYQAELLEENANYLVNFAYGRRGATLKTGTKTQSAVPYEKAKKIYDKLVNDKMGKGYLPSEEDAPKYVHQSDQVQTGIHCQLLNPLDEEQLEELLENDLWWAQEKMDGKRLLIKNSEELIAINRRGLSVGAPEAVLESAKAANRPFLIDGEVIDQTFYVFDILSIDSEDITEQPYHERLEILESLPFGKAINHVPTVKTIADKKALYTNLKATDTEGIVLKNSSAAYKSGRPNSGGNQFKFKFYETATVLVSKVNDKRSVAISVFENNEEIAVGNVTISVNKDIPAEGDIIEVRYLYAYKGGSLYQPTFLNIRTDMDKATCTITQLKYKKS